MTLQMKTVFSPLSITSQSPAVPTKCHKHFNSSTVEVEAGLTAFEDYIDNYVQYAWNSDKQEFWGDLGLYNFSGLLGEDYLMTEQYQVMDLLTNASLEWQSGLDVALLFDKLPTRILRMRIG